jgi:hypothetical protein
MIATAIVIAAVLISASLFIAIGQSAKTSTSTTTVTIRVNCTDHFSNGTASSVTDCVRGLTLGISDRPTIAAGSNQTIHLLLSNELNARSINFTSFPTLPGLNPSDQNELDYLLPAQSECSFPPPGYAPMFMALLNASGDPMQLSDAPPNTLACLSSPSTSYSFGPSQTVSEQFSVGGYWTSVDHSQPWINATYSEFSPGSYTIVAFDAWGQLAELDFTVSPGSVQLTNVPTMTVNGSLYYFDDVSSDITVGNPGYSFFHNASVTFLGVKFVTYCPPTYGGCPVPSGTTITTATTMFLGAIRLNATFADKSTETFGAVIGDDPYVFAFSRHSDPQAGVLVVYSTNGSTGGYKAYLLVS